jgi:hypothetical protein
MLKIYRFDDLGFFLSQRFTKRFGSEQGLDIYSNHASACQAQRVMEAMCFHCIWQWKYIYEAKGIFTMKVGDSATARWFVPQ